MAVLHESAAMESVCQTWAQQKGLDEACVNKLLELTPDMMATVMEGFSPKPGTMNASGLFMGYVRSIQQAQHGAKGKGKAPAPAMVTPELQGEVAQFVSQWGVDEECTNVLLEQRPQVIVDVMAGFKPKPDTRDIRSLFFGYLKSVSGISPAGCGKGGAALLENIESDIVAFIEKFGLDEECMIQLKQQSPSVARDVMSSFQPKPETENVRSLFLSFLRSVSNAHSGKGKGGFKGKDGKDGKGFKGSARVAPYGAPANTPAIGMSGMGGMSSFNQLGMQDFRSQPQMSVFGGTIGGMQPGMAMGCGGCPAYGGCGGCGGCGCCGCGGCAGCSCGCGCGCGGCGCGGCGCGCGGCGGCGGCCGACGCPCACGCGGCAACPGCGSCGACAGGCAANSGAVVSKEVMDFCNQWQLDSKCVDYLASQGPEVQREAIEKFRPKPGTTNVSGLFMGYLNSLVKWR